MAEFFGSVLFTRIMIAVLMISMVALVGFAVNAIINKKKNKKKAKALTNTKGEKEVKTEEQEIEEEQTQEQIQEQQNQIEEEISNVSEFEYNGVKYVKYQYGASETVCKPENSAKWITFAQSLQNSGKLEISKNLVDGTLVINKDNILECFITGNKEELALIQQNNLSEYTTEIKDAIKKQQTQQEQTQENKEVEA